MNALNRENCRCAEAYSKAELISENQQFGMTGGVSQNNLTEGFVPAFRDTATGFIYRSCFTNGTPAPIHVLDGLPKELVVHRDAEDRATAFIPTLVAGFLRAKRFYTREQAAEFMSKYH